MKIYFAGPLFTQGEWLWNAMLAEKLRQAGLDILLPQERAEPMLEGKETYSPAALFSDNVLNIEQADMLIAVFDQTDPDSGTCWECGYAYKLGKKIVGVRTDLRKAGDDNDSSINLMLSLSCTKIIELPLDKRGDIDWLAGEIILEVIAK